MANTIRTGVMWLSQTWLAVKCVKERLKACIATASYQAGFGLYDVLVPETLFERVHSDKMWDKCA